MPDCPEVGSAEVERDFGFYRRRAEGACGAPPEPVFVLHDDKPSVVIVKAEEYRRLRQLDRTAALAEQCETSAGQHAAREELPSRVPLPPLTTGLTISYE